MNQTQAKIDHSVLAAADAWARREIERTNSPPLEHYEYAIIEGRRLAAHYERDPDLIELGMILLDIMLGDSIEAGKPNEHVSRSVDAAKGFLELNHVPDDIITIVLGCIDSHHGNVSWPSVEAEICANADCYKFLRLRNWLKFLIVLTKERGADLDNALEYAGQKANEKWHTLTLDYCKHDLDPDYRIIRDIIECIRE